MQRVWFEKHPGLYSEELEYYSFYGLCFNSILDVAKFLKNVPYNIDFEYQGFYYKKLPCLLDVDSGIIYLDNGEYIPDKTFLDDYIRRYGRPK